MTLLKVQPDTEYTVEYIPIRFTIPRDLPKDRVMAMAYPVLKKAIEQLERLGDGRGHHYRFRDDLPIYYRFSHLQGDPDWFTGNVMWDAAKRLEQGYIDCVALLAFEQVLLTIEEDPAVVTEREDVRREWEAQFEQPLRVEHQPVDSEDPAEQEESETWKQLKSMAQKRSPLS